MLDHLQRENLFLVPLDGHGEWYRYHPLFRELLRTRLDRDGASIARTLLRRAADWCETDGQLETALRYAQDAGDVDRVARIAIALAQRMYAAGRSATVMGWFEWVDERGRDRAASRDRCPGGLPVRAHRPAGRRRPLGRSRGALVAAGCRRTASDGASRCG